MTWPAIAAGRSPYRQAHRRGQSGSGEAADYLAGVGDGHDYPGIQLAGQVEDHGGRCARGRPRRSSLSPSRAVPTRMTPGSPVPVLMPCTSAIPSGTARAPITAVRGTVTFPCSAWIFSAADSDTVTDQIIDPQTRHTADFQPAGLSCHPPPVPAAPGQGIHRPWLPTSPRNPRLILTEFTHHAADRAEHAAMPLVVCGGPRVGGPPTGHG